MSNRSLTFVTSNRHKFEEAETVAESYGIKLKHMLYEYLEIQADTLEEIVRFSINNVCTNIKDSFFLEDAALFVEGLHGFPGPYSSYVNRTISWKGILQLMNKMDKKAKKAYFQSVIGFYDSDTNDIKLFSGKCEGIITDIGKGSMGFGFDPIFAPFDSQGLPMTVTFAEMTKEEKSKYSHRSKSLQAFFQSL